MDKDVMTLYCCLAPSCNKTYNTKFNLKRHVEIAHFGIKRFKCEMCGGFYSSFQNLKEHRNLHLGLKPFCCQVCGDTFRQASQLSLHKRGHIGGKKALEDLVESESPNLDLSFVAPVLPEINFQSAERSMVVPKFQQ